jgi:hypothetical protein
VTGDVAQITDAYTRFIDPKIPVSAKADLIQDAPAFATAMVAASKNPTAQTISLQVTKVTVTSANKATVVFTLLVSGSPVLPDQHGFAIRDGGKWKVAGVTFCGLLAAQGPTYVPSACSQPAATSLPS